MNKLEKDAATCMDSRMDTLEHQRDQLREVLIKLCAYRDSDYVPNIVFVEASEVLKATEEVT